MTAQQAVVTQKPASDQDATFKILAIDSSTSMVSLALTVDQRVVAEANFCADRTLSARLVPEIERLTALAGFAITDLNLFAASIGPGSFTGVRGGVATIQGLALACGKPCYGFSSLALLAMNFSLSPYPVCPLLDARKSEVYGGLYDCSGSLPVPLLKECVLPPVDLLDLIRSATDQPVIFAGDGAQRYQDVIESRLGEQARLAPFQLHSSRAAHGALLALDASRSGQLLAPANLLPLYLRASDAELNRISKMSAGQTLFSGSK